MKRRIRRLHTTFCIERELSWVLQAYIALLSRWVFKVVLVSLIPDYQMLHSSLANFCSFRVAQEHA